MNNYEIRLNIDRTNADPLIPRINPPLAMENAFPEQRPVCNAARKPMSSAS